ncbi:MAG: Wzz/FepE/Etk N-terminal domain-containing protein [Candidatus Firestonebacteria bacterium]
MTEEAKELSLIDYWNIAWKYKKFISAVTGIVTVLAVIYSLILPKIYTATAVVLPPELEDISKGGSMMNRNMFSSLGDMFGGGFNYSNIVISMLKSNRMAEGIIEKFELQKIYKTASVSDAIKTLRGSTNISVTKEKAIAISVDSKDPKLAAELANYYIANLDIMNAELGITSAKPVARVLDKATPPEQRSKPTRSKIVLVAFAFSLFGCYSILVLRENNAVKGK